MLTERRHTRRLRPEQTAWRAMAFLRPGQRVRILNLSAGGALLASAGRMAPGTGTELQMVGPAPRRVLSGHIERCRVVSLSPLRYEAALVFGEPFDDVAGKRFPEAPIGAGMRGNELPVARPQ